MEGDQQLVEAGVRTHNVPRSGDWFTLRLPAWPRIWRASRRRILAWPVPPRWIPHDRREELAADGFVAACNAFHKFDPSLSPNLSSFVYHQILIGALARYRQEWRYALRCRTGLDGEEGLSPSGEESLWADDDRDWLRNSIVRLVADDRELIHHLFWDGWTENRVAGSMGISQQAVNQKKQKILLEWRRQFSRTNQSRVRR